MTDARFEPSQGATGPGDERFGYFSAPAATTSAPAVPQYGAPPPGPAGFGTAPESPFGGHTAYGQPTAYAPTPSRRRRGPTVALVIVALVLIVGGYGGWRAYERSRPVSLPGTFAGQPANVTPAAQTVKQTIVDTMRSDNPNIQLDAQIYGSTDAPVILGVARATEDISKDLRGADMAAASPVGDASCASATNRSYVICVRTAPDLTVIVLVVGGTPSGTATLVDAAWRQF